ncbi:YidC/Oxa1 family membrane protein insertase [Anaerosalibacter massiliensis]|uniref:YidC/Oxa1 family membrane protein insertase n=1 Tax=Anaerosalibacter massiliensis TaxID=1347392 RepID=A0A9X2MK30_9FIRM|nr:YidC/Oxa1 family membrane protein insertase [Anaerosalibacter massiliensis]MCR2045189.1 YidC/Oxa1 family membrane protein insertase [Anaerosalibacter massiliensis]
MTNLFNQLFNMIFNFTNDYGIAIIVFTILVKLALLPFSIKQKKSMKIQQKLSKEMSELKAKYKDDEETLNKEMVALYKKNPGSGIGFLLLFAQMPIFIAMYRAFSTNIVNAPTVILPWIDNLSHPDPYFLIPIIYIVSQALPSLLVTMGAIKNSTIPKLSASMLIPSIIIALLFLTKSPAALGLYFIISNIISNVEQLIPISN